MKQEFSVPKFPTKNFYVFVNQDHIKYGKRYDCTWCPISTAVSQYISKHISKQIYVEVGLTGILFGNSDIGLAEACRRGETDPLKHYIDIPIDKHLRQWLLDYDEKGASNVDPIYIHFDMKNKRAKLAKENSQYEP